MRASTSATISRNYFVDSTSNLDQSNCTLSVLSSASPIGALPLGILISTSQDQECYTQGRQRSNVKYLLVIIAKSLFFSTACPSVIILFIDQMPKYL